MNPIENLVVVVAKFKHFRVHYIKARQIGLTKERKINLNQIVWSPIFVRISSFDKREREWVKDSEKESANGEKFNSLLFKKKNDLVD